MKKPLIGVVPLVDKEKQSYWMLPGYMKGVEDAGGLPFILPLTTDASSLSRLADLCDGILLTGGQDVSPKLYGCLQSQLCGEPCAERDVAEYELIRLALSKDKAVLGICRGIQILNVYFGGSLYSDLPTEYPSGVTHCQKPPYDIPVHGVTVVSDTPLEKLLGARELRVNSYHHQAIKRLGEKLLPMAYSEDRLIEAVYLPSARFVWAVQWHPEYALSDENSRKIFRRFVSAAKRSDV